MHVMIQTLEGGVGPCLPHDLSVMNTYTQMTTGSKGVAFVVENLTAILISVAKGIKVTKVVAVTVVAQMEAVLVALEKLDEIQGVQ